MERIERFIAEAMVGKSDNTIKAYRHSLIKFAEYLDGSGTNINEYGRIDVQQYIASMQSAKRSASGINREIAAIKAYSKYADKAIAVESLRMTKPKKVTAEAPEWLNRNEALALLRATDRKRNRRDHAIVSTLLRAGLRVSELVALDRDDVVLNERSGHVTVIGKGNKERTVPLNAEARKAINDYLKQRVDNEPALFLSSLGKRISVRTVQAMLSNYGVHPHQLRHTYVKQLVDSGTPTATIMSLTGHTNADMVAWYSAPSSEDKQTAVDNLI
ncbi:tyrosine-type recombinase/integrase [Ureibacillus sp. Re31]|uniref:Tyrosine-type recombinase/integrase n=2 Tax=Ureibacillus galli TaxID=2762222 RepID=A0ABR8XH89_9BACL|nr:tyrosine-type recombinase/integrase [Ureibacillus galli]